MRSKKRNIKTAKVLDAISITAFGLAGIVVWAMFVFGIAKVIPERQVTGPFCGGEIPDDWLGFCSDYEVK